MSSSIVGAAAAATEAMPNPDQTDSQNEHSAVGV